MEPVFFVEIIPACDCHKGEWLEQYGPFETAAKAQEFGASLFEWSNVHREVEFLSADEYKTEYGTPDFSNPRKIYDQEWGGV